MNLRVRYIILLLLLCTVATGLCENARQSIAEQEEILRRNPDDRQALKTAAYLCLNIGDFEKAGEYGRRLIEIGERSGDRNFSTLHGMIITGNLASNEDNFDEAFRRLQTALAIAARSENHDALASVYNALGSYYLSSDNDISSAIINYSQGAEEAELAGNKRRYAIILSNLAGVYVMREDTTGIRYALEAYNIAEKECLKVPLFYSAMNLSAFYSLAEDTTRAYRFFERAEAAAEEIGLADSNLRRLINCFREQLRGNNDKAEEYCIETLKDINRMSAISSKSEVYRMYSEVLHDAGRYSEEAAVLQKALEEGCDEPAFVLTTYDRLSQCYGNMGNYAKALEYSRRHAELLRENYNLSRERAFQEARIKSEVDRHEARIIEQEEELRASHLRMIVLFVIILIITGMLVMRWRNYNRLRGLYRAIVSQNKEYISREKALRRQLEEKHLPKLNGTRADDILTRFRELMENERLYADATISVTAAAERIGTNRTYLSKAINDSTGKTFPQLINEYRIREAISLITDRSRDLPLKQICAEVGFSSISSFYSTFQTVTGMSPAKYRAQLRELDSETPAEDA